MKAFFKEFRDFISDGNIVDMAVAFIMGGALQALMKALVDDIFMPIIGIFTGSVSFSDWVIEVGSAKLQIGNFIGTTITFVLTAFIVFLMIKAMNKARQLTHLDQSDADEEAPEESELDVLQAIRDELAKQNQA
ncbi:large conductance mechanosensitive channel [Weissella uvarum]|uniref:large conductance mechanosensitive channel protein MscL n=1 Tax=Weissella uvarum TaxID=1479233 RepID=UPI00195FBB5B|nr:large conductance mechanosensitive channel protein MscL [Weissella uvarum]MBM7617742.1 large conductance mechanosensitive channel [Weissella uvarum]MCM0595879.1 large conductance mechanosensitive channel protein MscL [Weissella uvarum]